MGQWQSKQRTIDFHYNAASAGLDSSHGVRRQVK
jgi:hypothetical protein